MIKIKKAQLGVLFVHGIGQQRLGQTLTDFGEPFLQYLNDWLKKNNLSSDIEIDNSVEIKQAILARAKKQSCPNFKVDMQIKNSINCEKETWLFAESYWANSFHLPRNLKVTLWLMLATPWACFTHVGRKIRIPWHRFRAAPSKVKIFHLFYSFGETTIQIYFAYLLWIASLFIELLLVILALISILPIPAILRYVSWIHEKIAAVIGDSYIFVKSDVRRESAITQLQSDIEWIESQCENLVIVAHSQGAALTYLALKKNLSKKLKLLITFGSGLDKLNKLLSPRIIKKALLVTIGSVMLFSITLIIPSKFIDIKTIFLDTNINLTDSLTILAFLLISYSVPIILSIFTFESNQDIKIFKKNLSNNRVFWMDIYASADPVPSGPLFKKKEDTSEWFKSLCVWNERSIFSDHTTYRKNRECFFASIVNTISTLKLSHLPIVNNSSSYDNYILDYGHVARCIRSSGFKLTRYLLIITIFNIVFYNRCVSNVWGASLVTLFSGICEFFDRSWILDNTLTLLLVMVCLYIIISKFISLTGNLKSLNQDMKLPRFYKTWYPKVSFQLIMYFIFGYFLFFWSIFYGIVSFKYIFITTFISSFITAIFYGCWEFYNARKLCRKYSCQLLSFE